MVACAQWEVQPWGRWRVWGRSGQYEALVEATCDEPGTPLRAPTADAGLDVFCRDSFFGQARRCTASVPSDCTSHCTHACASSAVHSCFHTCLPCLRYVAGRSASGSRHLHRGIVRQACDKGVDDPAGRCGCGCGSAAATGHERQRPYST